MFGTKRPQYVRDAIAKANRERVWTDEMKAKHGHWLVGKKQKPESISKRIKRGKYHYAWRGNTPLMIQLRRTPEYKQWRKDVFERDNYTCQECGIRTQKGLGRTIRLEAHHIKSFRDHPGLRTELSNGLTLCADCHKREGRPKR